MDLTYLSNFYDDHHVTLFNPEVKNIIKQHLDKLEHPYLITDWTSNMDETDYKEHPEKNTDINYQGTIVQSLL